MNRLLFVILGTTLPLAALAAEPWQVQVTPLGTDQYQATVTGLPAGVPAAVVQSGLEPVARDVCGERGFRLERYRFESSRPMAAGDEEPGEQTFEQQFSCGGSVAEAEGPAAPRTPPTPDDERLVREQTLAYLAALDEGDWPKAYAMHAPEVAAMLDSPRNREQRDLLRKASGQPTQREVIRLTWYDDPANAPKGRYVAADYRAAFANSAFYCGYAMWLQQPDGRFRIIRIEDGVLDADTASTLSPEQLAGARRQLACRD